MRLTEQEYNRRAMGKFQDVTLLGIAVEPSYLIITGHHVESTSR